MLLQPGKPIVGGKNWYLESSPCVSKEVSLNALERWLKYKENKIGLASNFQDPHYTNHMETELQSNCKLRCSCSLVGL